MAEAVLDASVLLAVINGEAGSETLYPYLADGLVSTVNLAEVAARLADYGMPPEQARQAIAYLGVETVPFTEDHALASGALRETTRAAGLSLGDRACLALARAHNLPAFTADRAWDGLDTGVEIRLLR